MFEDQGGSEEEHIIPYEESEKGKKKTERERHMLEKPTKRLNGSVITPFSTYWPHHGGVNPSTLHFATHYNEWNCENTIKKNTTKLP